MTKKMQHPQRAPRLHLNLHLRKSSVAQLPFPQEKLQGFLQLVNLHRNQRNMRIVRKAGRQITESVLKMQLRTMMI